MLNDDKPLQYESLIRAAYRKRIKQFLATRKQVQTPIFIGVYILQHVVEYQERLIRLN